MKIIKQEEMKQEEMKQETNSNFLIKKDALGMYLSTATTHELLTKEKEQYYFQKLKTGTKEEQEQIKNIIIEHNLKLVIYIVNKLPKIDTVDTIDLIQEGNLGLLKAIEMFDHTKDIRFSTYATYWIRQKISRYLTNNSRTIRIPAHIDRRLSTLRRFEYEYYQEHNESPTLEECAAIIGVDVNRMIEIESYNQLCLSLSIENDGFDKNDNNIKKQDILNQYIDTKYNVETELTKSYIQESLLNALNSLTAKERKIIMMRFGINCNKKYTLQEISKELNITKEGVRQLQKRILKKLKNNKELQELQEYI